MNNLKGMKYTMFLSLIALVIFSSSCTRLRDVQASKEKLLIKKELVSDAQWVNPTPSLVGDVSSNLSSVHFRISGYVNVTALVSTEEMTEVVDGAVLATTTECHKTIFVPRYSRTTSVEKTGDVLKVKFESDEQLFRFKWNQSAKKWQMIPDAEERGEKFLKDEEGNLFPLNRQNPVYLELRLKVIKEEGCKSS
jgi:Na+-transporting NADH:ubiquinone oxidoreductase subunit NqrC